MQLNFFWTYDYQGRNVLREGKDPRTRTALTGVGCEVILRRSASIAKHCVDYNLVAGATMIGNFIYARWSHAGFAPSCAVTRQTLDDREGNVKRMSGTAAIFVRTGNAQATGSCHCEG